MAVIYRIEINVLEDQSLDVKVANPGGLTPWSVIGILEKLKTELVLSMPGPQERTEETEE